MSPNEKPSGKAESPTSHHVDLREYTQANDTVSDKENKTLPTTLESKSEASAEEQEQKGGIGDYFVRLPTAPLHTVPR